MSIVTTCRKLLIVGGGIENEPRVRHALQFDWQAVEFIARNIPKDLRALSAGDARFTFREREVTEQDVKNADLVFEDSGDRALAEQIAGWCEKHNILLNATDKPELCDLHYASLLIRDPLVVSIGSGGDAPAISAVLRRWLEQKIGPGWSTAARLLSETRQRLPSGQARMDLLKGLARNTKFLALIETDNESGMRDLIEDAIRRM
jgi:uroporphyrin-III C-methyltransferase/precorrin-2 dehydrogenase/sirohydrochlorin ferrochelatase